MEEARIEKVFVLYASQTGNSEQAAKELCTLLPVRLSPNRIKEIVGTSESIRVEAETMQLDDFLEIEHAPWTRLTVIVMSSYGVGQAPLGGYRFRELCDAMVDQHEDSLLDGLSFALLGLGDSKFTTFFHNPTKTNEALTLAGAKRVGVLGKADASGDQLGSIASWIDKIWPELARVVAQPPLREGHLEEVQRKTLHICYKINPDMAPKRSSAFAFWILLVPVVIAIVVQVLR